MSDIKQVLEERGNRYGSFDGHATITQEIKLAMYNSLNWESRLSHSQREALDMIAHKIGRILNGDPNYLDSWVDIVGYTQLIVYELEAKKERLNPGYREAVAKAFLGEGDKL